MTKIVSKLTGTRNVLINSVLVIVLGFLLLSISAIVCNLIANPNTVEISFRGVMY